MERLHQAAECAATAGENPDKQRRRENAQQNNDRCDDAERAEHRARQRVGLFMVAAR